VAFHKILFSKIVSEFFAFLTIDGVKNEGQRAAKNRTTLCPVDGRRVALRYQILFYGENSAHAYVVYIVEGYAVEVAEDLTPVGWLSSQ